MKRLKLLIVLIVLALPVVWSQMAFAEQKTITIPKGTKVEKLGPGHFKFLLPNRQIVEVRNFDPKTGAISLVEIIVPDPPEKPKVTGKLGKFITPKKLTKEVAKNLPSTDYIMIDDDITWLPATIQFQVIKGKMKEGIKDLSPQPDPPGKR